MARTGDTYTRCGHCNLPIHPTAETKHPDFCISSVKEPSYMHSERCPLRRSTTKTKPYKSWEETWLEDVPTPSPVEGEWEKELTVIAKNVFLLHSVPPQMREAFAVFILRVTKLITTLLHDEREKAQDETIYAMDLEAQSHWYEKGRAEEHERIVKMCEEMKQIGDDHLGSQQNGCTYCWGVKQHNKALSSLRDKLTNNV